MLRLDIVWADTLTGTAQLRTLVVHPTGHGTDLHVEGVGSFRIADEQLAEVARVAIAARVAALVPDEPDVLQVGDKGYSEACAAAGLDMIPVDPAEAAKAPAVMAPRPEKKGAK